jgi:hypothetical protein
MAMTFREFNNALRIMRSIDEYEFMAAVYPGGADNQAFKRWELFRDNPHDFFIRADDTAASGLWSIVEKRMGR